jgi:hypothetical protein
MAANAPIKLADVQPYLNSADAAGVVASHYGEPASLAKLQVAQAEAGEMQAGF